MRQYNNYLNGARRYTFTLEEVAKLSGVGLVFANASVRDGKLTVDKYGDVNRSELIRYCKRFGKTPENTPELKKIVSMK